MIFSKKIRKIFFGFICIFIVFSSKARLNSFEANDSYPWNCDTTGLYDANTTVTFYGDSRIDLADDYWVEGLGRVPFYGHVGLDSHLHLLGLDGGIWNVQNLGHSTWTTSNLLTHLRNCMQSQGGVVRNQSYLTSKNVAFEIGGNDFLFNTPVVSLTPWLLPSVADHALNNTEQIIRIFQKKGKEKILLIGGYPAMGYSFINPRQYPSTTFKPLPLPAGEIDPYIYKTSSNCPSYSVADYAKALDIFTALAGSGDWWKLTSEAFGTVASIGMLILEAHYPTIVSSRNINFISPWGCMQGKSGEMWVTTPELMTDFAHPNFWGYVQWSIAVKPALSSLGLDRKPVASTIALPTAYNIPELIPPTECSFDFPSKTIFCGGRWFETYSFSFQGLDGAPPYTINSNNLPSFATFSAVDSNTNTAKLTLGRTNCANAPYVADYCHWDFDVNLKDAAGKTDTIHVKYATGL